MHPQSPTFALALFGFALLTAEATRHGGVQGIGRSENRVDAVRPNDNRVPAGVLRNDTLFVRLEVRLAQWQPEGPDGATLTVEAIAEEGKAPQIPGPLLRMPEGTTVVATVTNRLADSTLVLRGFVPRPSPRDSTAIAPGESRTLRFASGAPGTYLYRMRPGRVTRGERDVTSGAFIVDPRGTVPNDRVFVINIWSGQIDSTRAGAALAINGLSWPHTELQRATVGDTTEWRVVNASVRGHPMHLHGAYFRVRSKGHIWVDTTFAADRQRDVVTEAMDPGQTMRISWAPVEPGRWIFHCHLVFHAIAPDVGLDGTRSDEHAAHSDDPRKHMAGLVMGIEAQPRADAVPLPRRASRTLDLHVTEGPRRTRSPRAMSFVLQQGAAAPAADSVLYPSSLLVLTRGEETDIRVHNRLTDPTSVHWHGLELESYSDGVAGWGGLLGTTPPPSVAPGATFTARLTTPRAGTFMYHTHLRDVEQLSSGLYGPLVVLEPGERFDPSRDHVTILGWDAADSTVQLLINGDSLIGPPIAMRVGETHRFRFINIGPAASIPFSIRQDSTLQNWVPVAKDGATLPPALQVAQPARLSIDVGETYDFLFTPAAPGTFALVSVSDPTGRPWRRPIVVSP